MPQRKYPKGMAKRDEILRAALPLVARDGYSSATLRDLASEVGISQTGVLHHFGSREQLFTELVRRRDEENSARFAEAEADPTVDGLADVIDRLLAHNATVPGLAQLYAGLVGDATARSHTGHEYFRDRYDALREQLAESLDAVQGGSNISGSLDTRSLATLLIAVMDGLQLQWLYNPTIDMAQHVRLFLDLVGGFDPPAEELAVADGSTLLGARS